MQRLTGESVAVLASEASLDATTVRARRDGAVSMPGEHACVVWVGLVAGVKIEHTREHLVSPGPVPACMDGSAGQRSCFPALLALPWCALLRSFASLRRLHPSSKHLVLLPLQSPLLSRNTLLLLGDDRILRAL